MMEGRWMGIDYGSVRVGIALSDLLGITAQGYGVLSCQEQNIVEEIKKIIVKEDVIKIVLGFPKNMNGTIGPKGEEVLRFKEALEKDVSIPVELHDERLSTKMAERSLIEGHMRRDKRKQVVDKIAAQLILQGYMEMHR